MFLFVKKANMTFILTIKPFDKSQYLCSAFEDFCVPVCAGLYLFLFYLFFCFSWFLMVTMLMMAAFESPG